MYNTNQCLHLHLNEVIVPIGTARLALLSLADELFRSEEDEDTSGTADTHPDTFHFTYHPFNALAYER